MNRPLTTRPLGGKDLWCEMYAKLETALDRGPTTEEVDTAVADYSGALIDAEMSRQRQ